MNTAPDIKKRIEGWFSQLEGDKTLSCFPACVEEAKAYFSTLPLETVGELLTDIDFLRASSLRSFFLALKHMPLETRKELILHLFANYCTNCGGETAWGCTCGAVLPTEKTGN